MDYNDINDYELIYRIRENDDEEAVNIMVKKYEPLIVNFARKYFVQLKYQGADMTDLVQEGRIAVFKALSSYDPNSVSIFFTYVTICIERRFITYCRNLGANKYSPLNYSVSDDCLYEIKDYSCEPYNIVIRNNEENSIMEFKNSLDFVDSNIFELRYNGFSYKEISELLDISISAVSRHLCKIRNTLQIIKDKF